MKNFISLHYWFNSRPDALAPKVQFIFIAFLVMLLFTTIFFGMYKTRVRGLFFKIWRKLYNFFLSNFIIGLILLFFSYEMVPFLSARAWILFWSLSMLGWLIYISMLGIKLPRLRLEKEKEKEFKKYIP
jgi:hypothetical protein